MACNGLKMSLFHLLRTPNRPVSFLEKHIFDPFFCPETTHFQGILGFMRAKTGHH